MSEPFSATAGAIGAKLASATWMGAILGSIVVMSMTYPKTYKERVVAIAVTVFLSIYGGAAAIDYFNLHAWTEQAKGLAYFLTGLPGWVTVRGFFAWTERDPNRSLLDMVKDIRKAWKSEE
jgi:hypothetical protein